jgi:hypothetical protein
MKEIAEIEVVEDRTPGSRCDEGFLTVRRLTVRNRYADGSVSADYPCDIVSRPSPDAVALLLYRIGADRDIKVVLKESPRVPIYLRKDLALEVEEPRTYRTILEIVAGMIEAGDGGREGMRRRAAAEAREESGHEIDLAQVAELGDGTFASPGTSDEKVYYCSVPLDALEGGEATGDGTTMEEATRPVVFDLREAIRMCRDGRLPDMKTEVGLLRLADRIGYLPQLDRFVHELDPDLRAAHDSLGVEGA